MELDVVLVSPMRRCQETAYLLLKGHPRFDQIKFILTPQCREWLHTAGDIPRPLSKSRSYAKELFPNIDTETYFKGYQNDDQWMLAD